LPQRGTDGPTQRRWAAALARLARHGFGITRRGTSRGLDLLAKGAAQAVPRRPQRSKRAVDAATELADAALAGEPLPELATRLARLARTLSGAAGASVLHPAEGGQLLELGRDGSPVAAGALARDVLELGMPMVERPAPSPRGSSQVALPLRHGERTLGVLTLQFERRAPRDLRQLRPLVTRAGTVLSAAEREARKDRFLGFAAHELKTPLTSIKGFAYSLARRLERGEPADARAVQVLERQAERLHGLLEEMLEVSRIDMGRFALHLESCDLGELVQAANRVLRRLGAQPFEAPAPRPPLPLQADRDRLERALVALALRAQELGVLESLALKSAGGRAVAQIGWFGPELSFAEQAEVFEPRWDGRDKPRSGLGMGLSLARMVARMHGGDLRVEAGTFVLELPLRAPAEERRGDGRGRRILVVDDDEAIASMLADFLCESGFQAAFALGGRAALQLLERGPMPDLLVLDLRMPEIDGRALLLEARARLKLSSRVVLLSADRAVAAAAAELGAEAFVEKPFAPEGLLAAILRALGIERTATRSDP
jgi:signal transduction histidine kinase/ActR/RegA family two-component response regulator